MFMMVVLQSILTLLILFYIKIIKKVLLFAAHSVAYYLFYEEN